MTYHTRILSAEPMYSLILNWLNRVVTRPATRLRRGLYAVVTTTIRLRFDHDTSIRRPASRPGCSAAV